MKDGRLLVRFTIECQNKNDEIHFLTNKKISFICSYLVFIGWFNKTKLWSKNL